MDIYQTNNEVEILKAELDLIKRQIKNGLRGNLIEVGVMWGGSAMIIRQTIPDIPLYLFDTFIGLPNKMVIGLDSDLYKEGDMAVDIERVRYCFRNFKNTFIYPGIFPQETGKYIKNEKFAFVHLDVDIYESTRDALIFLYPRVNINGSILIHDYPAHEGVKKAVDELMDGVGTFEAGKWKEKNMDLMIPVDSGGRQLIIRKKIPGLKLNLKREVPKYPQVKIEEEEIIKIISNK